MNTISFEGQDYEPEFNMIQTQSIEMGKHFPQGANKPLRPPKSVKN